MGKKIRPNSSLNPPVPQLSGSWRGFQDVSPTVPCNGSLSDSCATDRCIFHSRSHKSARGFFFSSGNVHQRARRRIYIFIYMYIYRYLYILRSRETKELDLHVPIRPGIGWRKVNKPCQPITSLLYTRILPQTNKVSTCRMALYLANDVLYAIPTL